MAESEADFTNIFKKKPDRAQESLPGQEGAPPPPARSARAPFVYNPSEWYYDMSGDKFMLIFNHYKYKNTRQFNYKQPSTRTGTARDVSALETTFSSRGFRVTPYNDKNHPEILNILRDFCAQVHRNTSCVCVCVLTHGERGGELFAAEQRYEMKDLLNILQFAAPGLVGKPKLLIVQACRGGLVDPGQEAVQLDGPDDGVLLLPSHVDTLVLTSSVEDYVSWRDADGSWLIQELCRVVDATHAQLDVQQMVALVTSLVARERQSNTPSDMSTHKMKQTPEMRCTLTKLLMLTPPPLHRKLIENLINMNLDTSQEGEQ